MIGCKHFVSVYIWISSCFFFASMMTEKRTGLGNISSTKLIESTDVNSSEVNGSQIDHRKGKRSDGIGDIFVFESINRTLPHVTSNVTTPFRDETTVLPTSFNNKKIEFICDHNFTEIVMPPEDMCLHEKAKGGFFCLDVPETCNGFCGQSFPIRCSCDIHCEIYDTCCTDFRSECPDLYKQSTEKFGNLLDVNVQCLDFSPGYFVIASCSKASALSTNKDMCENVNTASFVPVSVGHFHFKNIHCLICNGFDENEAENWVIFLKFPLGENDTENVLKQGGMTTLKMIMEKSKKTLRSPSQKSLHLCSKDVVRSCPDETSIDIQDKCHRGQSNVVVVENGKRTVYQNRHCAECNVASKYVCILAGQEDYEKKWIRFVRLSSLLVIEVNSEKKDSFIIRAPRPFLWVSMLCEGPSLNRKCEVIKCRRYYEHGNNSCISFEKLCITVNLSWSGHCKTNSICSSAISRSLNLIRLSPKEISLNIVTADIVMSLFILHIETNFKSNTNIETIYHWLSSIVSKSFSDDGYSGWFSICIGRCENEIDCIRFNETIGASIQTSNKVLSSPATALNFGHSISIFLSFLYFFVSLMLLSCTL